MMSKAVFKHTGLAVWLFFATMNLVSAQEDGGPLFELGKTIFDDNCSACHQPTGEGVPPNFPALDGNERLTDHALIIRQVRAGKKAMPAFPDLVSEEIAAVANYVRNAWTNTFGPVSIDQVEEILATVKVPEAEHSIWDGVYATSQAKSARLIYLGGCAPCHGRRLNGAPDEADMAPAPPLAGTTFLRDWDGRSLASLFEYVRTTMPIRNPGQFSDQQYSDIIAYMLSYGDIPAGDNNLVPNIDVLSNIVIEKKSAGE